MNFDAIPLQPATAEVSEQNKPAEHLKAQKLRVMLHEDGERLEELKTTLRSLVIAGGSANTILHSLEHLQHEAFSHDDSSHKYESISQEIGEVNHNLASLPAQIVW